MNGSDQSCTHERGPKIVRIVVTGGPCGGKTMFLEYAKTRLSQLLDVVPIVVPEVAREFIKAGIYPNDRRWRKYAAFQEHVFAEQLRREQRYLDMAHDLVLPKDATVVLLHDRGLLDNGAYISLESLRDIMAVHGYTHDACLERYHAVLHLVTAAHGTSKHYVCDGERFEPPEVARELDDRILDVWGGHARHSVINNATNFTQKIARAYAALEKELW